MLKFTKEVPECGELPRKLNFIKETTHFGTKDYFPLETVGQKFNIGFLTLWVPYTKIKEKV